MSPETAGPSECNPQQAQIAELLQRAESAGVVLRSVPTPPLTCCGRGCNGCVWEGYFTALTYWCEDAEHSLGQRQYAADTEKTSKTTETTKALSNK